VGQIVQGCFRFSAVFLTTERRYYPVFKLDPSARDFFALEAFVDPETSGRGGAQGGRHGTRNRSDGLFFSRVVEKVSVREGGFKGVGGHGKLLLPDATGAVFPVWVGDVSV